VLLPTLKPSVMMLSTTPELLYGQTRAFLIGITAVVYRQQYSPGTAKLPVLYATRGWL
jgi:hypothetical protein